MSIYSLSLKIRRFFVLLVLLLRRSAAVVSSFFLGGEKCLCCDKNSSLSLCKNCITSFISYKSYSSRCKVCGKELISEIDICSSCKNERVLFSCDGVFPVHPYRLWKKNLLFAWKTEEKRLLSPLFAKTVFKNLVSFCNLKNEGKMLPVVPVPPRPGKIRQKGWDQIEELTFYMKTLFFVQVFPVLRRLSKKQQKKLGRTKRLIQAKSSFVLEKSSKIRQFLKNPPEKVALIDDVMTTGSTIEACSHALKEAGVKTVFVFPLFIVD